MFSQRLITAVLAAAICAAAASTPARAVDSGVMATVHQFIDGFNKGDLKRAVAACAPSAFIIDDFPPHLWQGSACADWARDLGTASKSAGITNGIVTLGKPWQVAVTGDRAYVVVPATYTYKQHGKPVTESGSVLTVVLKRGAAGWRITAWAWAQH
jgi:ketosteroid isomerase-like protein